MANGSGYNPYKAGGGDAPRRTGGVTATATISKDNPLAGYDNVLKSINDGIMQMNRNLLKNQSVMKNLNKDTEKAGKTQESLIKRIADLSDPTTWYGKAWVAVRRISSRVAPEFWAIQNATVGAMDTVKSYYLFLERHADKEGGGMFSSLASRKKDAEALEDMRKSLKLSKVIAKNRKKEIEDLTKNSELYKKLGKEVDQLHDTYLDMKAAGASADELFEITEQAKGLKLQRKILLSEFEKKAEKLKDEDRIGLSLGVSKRLKLGQENMAKFWNKYGPGRLIKLLKNVGTMAKQFLIFTAKVILGVGLLYILFKRFNIKDFLIGFVKGIRHFWDSVKEPLYQFLEKTVEFGKAIYNVGAKLFEFLSGEMDFNTFLEQIKPLLKELGKAFLWWIGFGINLLVKTIWAVIEFAAIWLGEWFLSFRKQGSSFLGALIQMVTGIATIAAVILFIASGAWIYAIITALVGLLISSLSKNANFGGRSPVLTSIGGKAQETYEGAMAKGGMTKKGGLYLVGERGPELVSLPGGANVYNNAQTQSMTGNTYNITVQGRIGASDAELRDIAQKIGRMVNMEVNRTTASRTRGA